MCLKKKKKKKTTFNDQKNCNLPVLQFVFQIHCRVLAKMVKNHSVIHDIKQLEVIQKCGILVAR